MAGSATVRATVAEGWVGVVGAVVVAVSGSAVVLAPLRAAVASGAEGRVVAVVAASAAGAVVAVVTVVTVAVVAERETVAALAEAAEAPVGAGAGFVCEPLPAPSDPVLPSANPSLRHATSPRFLRAAHTCRPGEAAMP